MSLRPVLLEGLELLQLLVLLHLLRDGLAPSLGGHPQFAQVQLLDGHLGLLVVVVPELTLRFLRSELMFC